MPINAVKFSISALAVYRLTRLITEDEITYPIRDAIWQKYPSETTKIGYLISCPWCVSIYVASALEIARILIPKSTTAVETVLALSAATGLIAAHTE